ncbi:MAG TPA: VIT1/CCC1 transporter family protein [Chloroflexota bacterium]|nr:VIT1/CCC1 transporter family protein [Chloroflexota bacterium]
MGTPVPIDPHTARRLILDELFDLSLYTSLRPQTTGALAQTLAALMQTETKHRDVWQELFGVRIERLDWTRKVKLWVLLVTCRLFGDAAVYLVLEAIEVRGIAKYLSLWERYRETALEGPIRSVLQDEFQHEDAIVSETSGNRVRPERVGNVLLGFNDGLVEMVGAMSGFFAAFGSTALVLPAAASVAVAGGFSMAAGAYSAASSEAEVGGTELRKQHFLGNVEGRAATPERPVSAARLVGLGYVAGALVPILPVVFGANSIWASVVAAAIAVVLVSGLLSFVAGMALKRRTATNLLLTGASVAITYSIGLLMKIVWGVSV